MARGRAARGRSSAVQRSAAQCNVEGAPRLEPMPIDFQINLSFDLSTSVNQLNTEFGEILEERRKKKEEGRKQRQNRVLLGMHPAHELKENRAQGNPSFWCFHSVIVGPSPSPLALKCRRSISKAPFHASTRPTFSFSERHKLSGRFKQPRAAGPLMSWR